ncbi:hypothetical protein R1flu_016884 [Riccia fluitans]|uniref:Uncharacterized protein n=1 Tax=Riccia fluitans TaxID=41844 RepID=A0ABD1YNM8_9MARC
MLPAVRRIRVPRRIGAFSTFKDDDPVKRQSGDLKSDHPEAQVNTGPEQSSFEWEGRDSNFEAMSKKVVGIIKTRPGGRQEMGNAVVTEESTRPKPTDRHTTLQSGPDEESVIAAGTLNMKQIREVFLLYQEQGKNIQSIAEEYNLDHELLKRVFKHTSLALSDQAGEFQFKDKRYGAGTGRDICPTDHVISERFSTENLRTC